VTPYALSTPRAGLNGLTVAVSTGDHDPDNAHQYCKREEHSGGRGEPKQVTERPEGGEAGSARSR